jgi:hypothetical protein
MYVVCLLLYSQIIAIAINIVLKLQERIYKNIYPLLHLKFLGEPKN